MLGLTDISIREIRLRQVETMAEEYVCRFLLQKIDEDRDRVSEIDQYRQRI